MKRRHFESLESRWLMTVDFTLEDVQVDGDTTGFLRMEVGDVDSDGSDDIVFAFDWYDGARHSGISWLRNQRGHFSGPQSVQVSNSGAANDLALADIDGDGDTDVIQGESDPLIGAGSWSWLENDVASGTFHEHFFDERRGKSEIVAADFDGDGDIDVFGESPAYNAEWRENLGDGTFSTRSHSVPYAYSDGNPPAALDLDGDGDVDLLGTWSAIINNSQGEFEYRDYEGFSENATLRNFTHGDIDNDGDDDVIVVSIWERDVYLVENLGNGEFAPAKWIPNSLMRDILNSPFESEPLLLDVNNDGYLDIVTFANQDSGGDGQKGFGNGIYAYLNDGGTGEFDPTIELVRHIDGTQNNESPIAETALIDLEGDGDTDIVFYSREYDRLMVLRNNHVPLSGDSNRDGVFNSSDLVFVFQKGEYEDGEESNSTFEDGDWNGDGEFDSADFVFAFQAGNYSFAANLASSNDVDSLFATAAALQSDRDGSGKFRKPLPLNVNGTENGLFDPFIAAAKDKR